MRYKYECAKCGAAVTKEPTSKTVGLHGWKCATCGPTKVKRKLAAKE